MNDLLQRIYNHPDEDPPRHVYADMLTDAGDPRGEFIALQLAQKRDRKREKQLLKKHRDEWLGPLGPVLRRTGLEWHRGFPVAGRMVAETEDARAATRLPEWSTFERLWLDQFVPVAFVRDAPLRALRQLVVHVTQPGGDDIREVFTDALAPPNLTWLRIRVSVTDHVSAFAWLIESVLGSRLEHLCLEVRERDLSVSLLDATGWAGGPATLCLFPHNAVATWHFELRRDDKTKKHSRLYATFGDDDSEWWEEGLEPLLRGLQALPVDALTALSVYYPWGKAREEHEAALGRVAARFTSLDLCELPRRKR